MALPYRDFPFPLNVFMDVLTLSPNRAALVADLGLSPKQIDGLIERTKAERT